MDNFWNGGFELLTIMALVLIIKVDEFIQNKRRKK